MIGKKLMLGGLLAGLFLLPYGLPAAETVDDAPAAFVPDVAPPIPQRGPKVLKLVLTTSEKNIVLMHGFEKDTLYPAWTFNGHVPGPFVRARVGDTLEVHLINPSGSKMSHNVDIHAISGPGGGAPALLAAPGQEKVGRFKLLTAGLFIYHCAAPPVAWHIANGMYGMILVEPQGGLPPVDREIGVVQSEFYTKKPFGAEGLQEFDFKAAEREQPTYIVFNGAADSFNGEHPLKAKVGEKVRVYFGNPGPNLDASWHIIGITFDKVNTGGFGAGQVENVQTVLVPAGGTAVAEFTLKVPGNYTFVDHSIFRTMKGALGVLHVDGSENGDIYPVQEGAAKE